MQEKYTEFKSSFSAPSFQFTASPADYAMWRRQAGALSGAQDLESVMKAAAGLVSDGSDPAGTAALQRAVLRSALDWLETLRQRVERLNRTAGSVRLYGTETSLADSDGKPVPGTARPVFFAWNERSLEDRTAMDLIESGAAEFCDQMVRMSPAQARYLFPDMYEAARQPGAAAE